MRILNVNSYYFSSSLYKPMEESFIKAGHHIKTYVPLSTNYTVRDECKFDVPSYIDVEECYKEYERVIFHLKHKKIIMNFLKKYNFDQYDIMHAHSLFSNGYVAYSAHKKYKIPYIVAVRDTDLNVFFKRMIHLRKMGVEIMTNASKIIFLSPPYRDECINNYVPNNIKEKIYNKSVVIPNGIDNYWFLNKFSTLRLPSKRMVKLLFVGNISKRKNLITVLKACEILINKNINVQLTVVGKILDESIGEKLRKSSITKLIDRVDKKELLSIYRQNDIFVMPSITETFGLVYAEAMSQGLPVIYTRNQGFDQQFEDGIVGYSCDCMNANEISENILNILQNYCDMSNRCINLVDKFSWESIQREYEKVYSELKC